MRDGRVQGTEFWTGGNPLFSTRCLSAQIGDSIISKGFNEDDITCEKWVAERMRLVGWEVEYSVLDRAGFQYVSNKEKGKKERSSGRYC